MLPRLAPGSRGQVRGAFPASPAQIILAAAAVALEADFRRLNLSGAQSGRDQAQCDEGVDVHLTLISPLPNDWLTDSGPSVASESLSLLRSLSGLQPVSGPRLSSDALSAAFQCRLDPPILVQPAPALPTSLLSCPSLDLESSLGHAQRQSADDVQAHKGAFGSLKRSVR
jgi:hypothetical protein